ncbi:MAG TPA: MFS transporter [Thermoanaerobaculia bacterium]|nr:MFS transporter [Thermoanaerobaculia bacterium]
MAETERAASDGSHPEVGGRYARYVLAVLVLVYVFNFIDRQILSILAEEIKADLGLGDAEIGFLYGTAFAVFYAVFGIPLGRLADVWVRRSVIASGLFFWSGMTALSGTARSFGSLAGYRIGVGVGEASASPAAFSMLSDYFPPRLRATALGIYSSGVYIGAGIGLLIGGQVVDRWNGAFPDGGPFGLVGWQAAFFVVGLPGLLMAIWVRTLREPIRGMAEGLPPAKPHPAPFKELGRELMAVLPPFTFIGLALEGGARPLVVNLVGAGVIAAVAWGLVVAVGPVAQWVALGIGVYCAFSWSQSLALRDRPAFELIFKTRSMVLGVVGFASIAFVGYGFGFWVPPYFIRQHGISAGTAGLILGSLAALGGWMGVTFGGILSDRLKEKTPHGRMLVGLLAAGLAVPAAFVVVYASNLTLAYAGAFVFNAVSSMWVGPGATTPNDLVLPRMRGAASAFYLLMVTFIGLALGPFTIGQLSDLFVRGGASSADALRSAMVASLLIFVVTAVALLAASRYVGAEESSRVERARAAGEA